MTNFSDWYAKNKVKIAEKRKKRYHSDPEYRRKAKENAKRSRKPTIPKPLPSDYAYSLKEASDVLGVSPATIREWLRKKYIPKPVVHQGRFIFNSPQIDLMERVREFMATKASKTSIHSNEFENLKVFIRVNWK